MFITEIASQMTNNPFTTLVLRPRASYLQIYGLLNHCSNAEEINLLPQYQTKRKRIPKVIFKHSQTRTRVLPDQSRFLIFPNSII